MKLPLAMCHFGGSFLETSFWLRVTLVEVSSKLPLATGHFGGSFLETSTEYWGSLVAVCRHFAGSFVALWWKFGPRFVIVPGVWHTTMLETSSHHLVNFH